VKRLGVPRWRVRWLEGLIAAVCSEAREGETAVSALAHYFDTFRNVTVQDNVIATSTAESSRGEVGLDNERAMNGYASRKVLALIRQLQNKGWL
jgi:hypothetical protein